MFEATAFLLLASSREQSGIGGATKIEIVRVCLGCFHFVPYITLSMRTVILCSVLAVQHEQSADTQFDRHCDPHAGETEAADKNQCQTNAHDPDTAEFIRLGTKVSPVPRSAPAATMDTPKSGSASSSMRRI